MPGCCHHSQDQSGTLTARQTRMLWVVLAINATMFVLEFGAGLLAASTALLGDSLDMLGDALVYGFSLLVVARGLRWKALAAVFKGGVMMIFGVVVLAEAASKLIWPAVPDSGLMGAMGLVVLAANLVCLVLLTRHRGDDINMRSAWICSRNDRNRRECRRHLRCRRCRGHRQFLA